MLENVDTRTLTHTMLVQTYIKTTKSDANHIRLLLLAVIMVFKLNNDQHVELMNENKSSLPGSFLFPIFFFFAPIIQLDSGDRLQ